MTTIGQGCTTPASQSLKICSMEERKQTYNKPFYKSLDLTISRADEGAIYNRIIIWIMNILARHQKYYWYWKYKKVSRLHTGLGISTTWGGTAINLACK